jgi:hypothetical protein
MLIFCDSFDTYNSIPQKYDSNGGPPTIGTAYARTGRNGMLCSTGGGAVFAGKNFSSRSSFVIGFAINCQVINVCAPFLIYDSGSVQITLTIDLSGTVKVYRGYPSAFGGAGTVLGTGSSIISPLNAWHYLETKVVISTTVGTVDVHLDGVSILSLTGQNTQATSNATWNQVSIGLPAPAGSNTVYVDDFYLCDTTGSFNNTFLGDVSILARLPSGNGTLNNFTNVFASYATGAYAVGATIKDSNGNVQECSTAGTASTGSPTWATTGGSTTSVGGGCVFTCVGTGSNPGAQNWMAVQEYPPDDNSSYVTDATVSDQDRYTYPSVAGSAVKAVVVNVRAEKDDSAARSIRMVAKSGATVVDNGTDFALTLNTYADFQGVFETDPNTSVAWTVSGVNAAEFGVKTTV